MDTSQTGFSRRSFLQVAATMTIAGAYISNSPSSATAAALTGTGLLTGRGKLPRGTSARYLIEDDFYFMEKTRYPLPDVWDTDQGGAVITQAYGRWFRVADSSALLPVLLMRPFQPQNDGVLCLEFRFEPNSPTLDGVAFTLRDGTTPVLDLRVTGSNLGLRQTTGTDIVLAPVTTDVELGLRVTINLNANTTTIAVGGITVAENVPLLTTGGTLDNFLVSSADSARTDMFFGPVRLYRDTIVNEQFINVTPGPAPTAWAAAASGVTLAVVERIHSTWADRFCLQAQTGITSGTLANPNILARGYTNENPFSVSEFTIKIETGGTVIYRIGLELGQTLELRFTATTISVVDNDQTVLGQYSYRRDFWNHIVVRINVPESTLDLQVNGKRILSGVEAFDSLSTAANPPSAATLTLAASTRVLLDDVQVYWEAGLPANYVPAPVVASTGSQHQIGISEFGGWRTGHHLGWDLITRFPERKPYLGWYDDGIPEVADWENKWMAEAGIAFRIQCWFRPQAGVGQPIKVPEMHHSLHDGYFESEYSNAVKFAIMWENVASGQTNSADFRANIVPYLIEYYFRDPRYYTIDGKPVFCVYNSRALITNFGSAAAAKIEIDYLRAAVQALGFADIIILTIGVTPEAADIGINAEYAYSSDGYPQLQQATTTTRNAVSPIDVLATLAVGRDDLPWLRTLGRIMPPEEFQQLAEWARDSYIPSLPAGHLGRRLTMLGNWNEWGEGHFIQPSEFNGFGYVNAIRDTFTTASAANLRPNRGQQARLQKLYPYGRELTPALGEGPPQTGAFTIEWKFNTDGDSEGWSDLGNVSGLGATGGALRATSTGADPRLVSPSGLGIEAAEHPYLRIRMKSNPIQQGEIFFITETDGIYSTSKGARFMAIPVPGSEYGEADIPLWRVSTWRGRIDQIRIDPITDAGTFAIDYIGLRHEPMTGPRVRLNGVLESQRRPEVIDGIVYASVELVMLAVGGRVGTSPDRDAVHIGRGSDTVTIPTTGTTIRHNGTNVVMQAPARQLADGSYGVPVSFFSSVLGFAVSWNSGTSELAIVGTPLVITVKADGSGQFTTPQLANESILDASAVMPYVIEVHPGDYVGREWTVKPFVTIRGTDRATCILRGDLPANATDAQITNSSTLWLSGTAALENLTILAKNMRYAIHDEAQGANANAVHTITNCRIEHVGNQAARDWRIANPSSGMAASAVWLYDRPYGYGSASGVHVRIEDSTLVGTREPFYIHTNKDFGAPTVNELVRCDLQLSGGNFASVVTSQELGSGTLDTVTLTDCTWSPGYINDSDSPWISTLPARQVSNHAEIKHVVGGTAALGYLPTHRGLSLRLFTLATTVGISMSISGSAVPVVFGPTTTIAGGSGLSCSVYGALDVSGILVGLASNISVVNTIGRRLGDRSLTPVYLVVTVGGETRTVTFDQNYTTQSNATIMTKINQALSGMAQANEYQIPQNEYYPSFPDREIIRTASGPQAVARWIAVVPRGAGKVDAATVSASAADVVGISLVRMIPGVSGRILTSGYLHRSQLSGLTGTTIPSGATIYLSNVNSGQFALSGTRVIATAVAQDWVAFRVS